MQQPTKKIDTKAVFGIETDMPVMGYNTPSDLVPDIDPAYQFNPETTLAILIGLMHDRRVMIQGLHGTGKSSHIEQVAARLNWPCMRVNLDGHMTRFDLVGKDTLVLENNKQITRFQLGIIPWSMQQHMMLVFDEYDAGKPDVMFVIQRLLEKQGQFVLPDKNQIIKPHPYFRLFATANTVGMGNINGLYHGSQHMNQAQIDRWNILVTLNYLPADDEIRIVQARVPSMTDTEFLQSMVSLANLTRNGFKVGEISNLMSPRTLISWAENYQLLNDLELSFTLSFLNKCIDDEKPLVAEYYQRCFNQELALDN